MKLPRHPSLFQINTRVWLTGFSRQLGRRATLDDIPDKALDEWCRSGFDWIWLLGVWQTGDASRRVSLANPGWRKEFEETLPDLSEEDIPGSSFAVSEYTVHRDLGGNVALARLRKRLQGCGLRLMVDFVPNHTALDHPWVESHPDYFIRGSEDDLARSPANYVRIRRPNGDLILAHGRDPYYPAWPDTLQLNYGNTATQEAVTAELLRIAAQCDGVRCDMAMLVLPDVFQRTWALEARPFWPETIRRVREKAGDFCFMAEVYWDREWDMQQQGFDYAYDKRLYDRLREGHARPVREHLCAGLDYQEKLVRFLENHDEPRAAAAFPQGQHEAAAVIAFLAPGLCLFHQGQFEGRLKRISPHLCRAPEEPENPALKTFYSRLLEVLSHPAVSQGQWRLLECIPAWDGNGSLDAFIAFAWQEGVSRLLVVVNYAGHRSQCFARPSFEHLGGRRWLLRDLLGDARHERDGDELQARGLFLDMPPWQFHAFEMTEL